MGATNLTPAQKRSITILQNAGLLQFATSVSPSTIPSAPVERTFKTKAQIAAGDGYPCTAVVPCSRTDLRTPARAASHAGNRDELQLVGHLPK